jgi:hypothetical protein
MPEDDDTVAVPIQLFLLTGLPYFDRQCPLANPPAPDHLLKVLINLN